MYHHKKSDACRRGFDLASWAVTTFSYLIDRMSCPCGVPGVRLWREAQAQDQVGDARAGRPPLSAVSQLQPPWAPAPLASLDADRHVVHAVLVGPRDEKCLVPSQVAGHDRAVEADAGEGERTYGGGPSPPPAPRASPPPCPPPNQYRTSRLFVTVLAWHSAGTVAYTPPASNRKRTDRRVGLPTPRGRASAG